MAYRWAIKQTAQFKEDRDKQRKSQGLCPFDQLDEQGKNAVHKTQKAELLKNTEQDLILTAWSLGRYPLQIYVAPYSGFIELPRNHMASSGFDRIKFDEGDNLNLITFNHYNQAVDSKSYPGRNYVSDGSILPKRHEYLGPSPSIAGYRFSLGTVQVLFWDSYLETRWIGKRKWDVELEFNPTLQTWQISEYSL